MKVMRCPTRYCTYPCALKICIQLYVPTLLVSSSQDALSIDGWELMTSATELLYSYTESTSK